MKKIHAKLGIANSLQSPDIGQNLDRSIFNSRFLGKSFMKESCDSSRTCNDIDMKLGPITRLDKRNTMTLQKNSMASH